MDARPGGADLAKPLETMEADLEASFGLLIPDVRRRFRALRSMAVAVLTSSTALLLWLGGLAAGRLIAVAVLLVAMAVNNPRAAIDLTTRGPNARSRRWSWPAFLLGVFTLCLITLSGGMHSPIVIVPPIVLAMCNVGLGWSRTTRAVALLYTAGLTALALAPPWVAGPPIREPAFSLLLIVTSIGGSVFAFSIVAELKRAMEAIEGALRRARELMLGQMCTRARDLEQVGASLSHELKNPLQAIKILVQLSAREVKEADARERLRVAETEVERMQALIKDYLSFSRPFDKLQPEEIDLGALADEVIAVLSVRAGSTGVSLERRGDARVIADPRRLREALHNLIANALDFSPRGSTVEVEIGESSGRARIAVRDSGSGMSKETLARLGTPFFTTREGGNGLGVALARAACAQHGGSLDYESAPGKGTTAIATLPLKPTERTADGPRVGG
jgi:signal transduction histidine kinase